MRRRFQNTVVSALVGLCALAGCGPKAKPRIVLVREGGQWIEVKAVEGTPQGELALIRGYMADEEHRRVISAAKTFRRKYPVDYRREDVAMLAGHAQMARGYYMKAHEWYARQLDEFPAGELFTEALEREYQIADAFLEGRNQVWEIFEVWSIEIVRLSATAEAIEILMRIAERAPTSELAERALLRIGDYHYEDENYLRAAEAYDEYLAMFPKRPRSPYAQLRAARAIYATYRGARYGSLPLEDAHRRFNDFAAAYPDRTRAEGIGKILDEIRDRRAEADYYVAELFERIGHPKAARSYYNQAAKRPVYGQTIWTIRAEAAVKRLANRQAAS